MSQWLEKTLGEFVSLQRGHDLTEPERRPGTVPVMGSAGQNGYHDTALAKGPGVVIGRSGASFGQVHFAHEDYWPHNTSLYVTDFHGNDPKFAYYLLKTVRFEGHNSGSAQPSLNRNFIYPIPVRAPVDPAEQRAIAAVLGDLDDKIELNRRMRQTLETIAQAIFKSWFVDFDPLRAKARELIAEGALAIGDGYRAKNDELGAEGMPFIRAAELNNGFDTSGAERLRPDRLEGAKSKMSQVGDVAFTSKGTVGRFARVGEHTEPFVYSPQICFWRSLRHEVVHPAILYCWMQSGEFISRA